MNSEQRQAVLQGLSNPLTVITGPPGTGKSQVVTSLLVNAGWLGKTVLFASKNNKAVDVVETRVNALGPRPMLLRLGSSQQRNFQQELAEYLISLLAGSVTEEDERVHEEVVSAHEKLRQRFEDLVRQRDGTVNMRNEVDRAEQGVEQIRRELGEEWFRFFKFFDEGPANQMAQSFQRFVARANKRSNSLIVQLLWPFLRRKRFRELWTAATTSQAAFERLDVSPLTQPPNDKTMGQWIALLDLINHQIESAGKVCSYFSQLEILKAAKSLEEISREGRPRNREVGAASRL